MTDYPSIGTVTADTETPNFQVFRFKAATGVHLPPSSFVAIEISKDRYLVGRVSASREQNPHEEASKVATRDALDIEPDYPEEGESVNIYRLYEASILDETINVGGTFKVAPAQALPKSGTKVFIPPNNMIQQFLGIAESKDGGLDIGTLDIPKIEKEDIGVLLKKGVIQRHVFIGGTTGSGKSYAAKVLAEEIHKKGIPIIFFDTQYEFVPLTEKLGGTTLIPATDYTVKLSSLSLHELLDIVPVPHPLHEQIVTSAFATMKSSGREFTTAELVASIPNIVTTSGASNAPQTTRIVQDRLNYYLNSRRYLGGGFVWKNVLKKGKVIDINCKNFDKQDLQAILAATLRELQRLRSNKEAEIPPFAIFIDEAHLFTPEGEESPCKQIIREYVRIGRHYGICSILITQSPVDIDKKVIRQCNTRLIFALEPDQLMAIQGVKADATSEMLNRLPKAPQGSCILTGTYETIKHAIPIRIRKMETQDADAGQTPDIFKEVDQYA